MKLCYKSLNITTMEKWHVDIIRGPHVGLSFEEFA